MQQGAYSSRLVERWCTGDTGAPLVPLALSAEASSILALALSMRSPALQTIHLFLLLSREGRSSPKRHLASRHGDAHIRKVSYALVSTSSCSALSVSICSEWQQSGGNLPRFSHAEVQVLASRKTAAHAISSMVHFYPKRSPRSRCVGCNSGAITHYWQFQTVEAVTLRTYRCGWLTDRSSSSWRDGKRSCKSMKGVAREGIMDASSRE